ncbi:MAG TPA: DUF4397 domain-containing protein [Patescibacteria group bacterium]|nr:DUF4397 domain-containing protein [Patescibacteria group bacterium]
MRFLKAFTLFVIVPIIISCGDDEPAAPIPVKPRVLFFHASPGLDNVDILVDNTLSVPGLAYSQNTGYLSLNSGNRQIKVNLAGKPFNAIDTTANFSNDRSYSFFLADTAIRVSPLILQDSIPTASAGKAFLRIVNLAHTQNAIDITDPNGIVVTRMGNIGFKRATSFIDLNPATLNFQITPVGSPAKLFDFKPTLIANKVYTVVVTGSSPNGYELIVNR